MIRRELAIFLIVGSLTVLLDFLSYRGLIWIGLLGTSSAKAAGFLIGTLFAYFANRALTFRQKLHAPGSALRFTLLYAATLTVNVSVNSAALTLLVGVGIGIGIALQAAFLMATVVSTCLNFLGMKFFVFKSRAVSEPL